MSNYEKFSKAERLEILCAEIYQLLARQHRADPAANALFLRLEAEELQHARRIQKLRSIWTDDADVRGAIELDLAEIDQLLADAEILKGLFSAPDSAISFDDASRFMAELEEKFAIAHADSMAAQADPEIREMFEILSEQDHAHAALLRR